MADPSEKIEAKKAKVKVYKNSRACHVLENQEFEDLEDNQFAFDEDLPNAVIVNNLEIGTYTFFVEVEKFSIFCHVAYIKRKNDIFVYKLPLSPELKEK